MSGNQDVVNSISNFWFSTLKAVEDSILWQPFLSWEVFLLQASDSLRQYHKILYFTAPIKNSKVL
jgi:hypothetical protein